MKKFLGVCALLLAIDTLTICFPMARESKTLAGDSLNLKNEVQKILDKEDAFVDALGFQGRVGIMKSTITLLDGKPKEWNEIPDEGTEMSEIHINMKTKIVIKIAYVTKKDI